ncbi:MAG TPA: OmpA family protein, partial [Calditrichae bacterium]|nr:OmpA family protein [Calditrichia bacterium]
QPLSFEELVIYGFADSLGTPAQNRRMARKRAESVRNFLQQLGIPATKMRIDVRNPVDRQVTNIAEARRVEFRVMP